MAYISKITDLDGSTYDLKSKVTNGILYGEVDSTSTATAFTAQIPGITEYYDGLTILLRNGIVTSASGFTININGLGGKPSYSNMTLGNDITPTSPTRDTTIFNINYAMIFVYNTTVVSTGCWICYRGYDANTNTLGYQLRTNSYILKTISRTRYYRLLFTSADNTHWVPANTTYDNSATSVKTPNQVPINPFGEIVYLGNSTNYAAEADVAATAIWQQYTFALGYSFNTTGAALTLTTRKPVYVKCAPQSDGSAIIDSTTPYVQELPSTDDGKIYILLGMAYSATNIELLMNHPVYYYKDGAVRLWTNSAAGSSITVDPAPISGSTNAVSSGGVYTALQGKQDTLAFDGAPTYSSTNPVESGGVFNALEAAGKTIDMGYITDYISNVSALNIYPNGINKLWDRQTSQTTNNLYLNLLAASGVGGNVSVRLKGGSDANNYLPSSYDYFDNMVMYQCQNYVFKLTGESYDSFILETAINDFTYDSEYVTGFFIRLIVDSTRIYLIYDLLKNYEGVKQIDINYDSSSETYVFTDGFETALANLFARRPKSVCIFDTTNNRLFRPTYFNMDTATLRAECVDGLNVYQLTLQIIPGEETSYTITITQATIPILEFDSTPTSGSSNLVDSGTVYTALQGKQDTLTFDSVPASGSSNPVTSDGIYTALQGKQDTLTIDPYVDTHSSNPVTSAGIYSAIEDAKLSLLESAATQIGLTLDSSTNTVSVNNGFVYIMGCISTQQKVLFGMQAGYTFKVFEVYYADAALHYIDLASVGEDSISYIHLVPDGTTAMTGQLITTSIPTATSDLTNDSGFITNSAIANMQTTGNLVTSMSSSSTDTQYPSAKLMYDTVGNLESLLAAI